MFESKNTKIQRYLWVQLDQCDARGVESVHKSNTQYEPEEFTTPTPHGEYREGISQELPAVGWNSITRFTNKPIILHTEPSLPIMKVIYFGEFGQFVLSSAMY